MKRFEMRIDPLTQEVYYEVPAKGYALMRDPLLNKGSAFPDQEREEFELTGLITNSVGTLEAQLERAYTNYTVKRTDLGKYIALKSLLDRNETLYYALLTRHIEEMLPIVYTPTVGQACIEMSISSASIAARISPPTTSSRSTRFWKASVCPDISLIVVTDSERILGLGDLGATAWAFPSASSRSTSPPPASIPPPRCRSASTSAPTTRSC